MRPVTLASLKTGITRLRDKGGANPQTLYDLVNGYVDESGSPVSRPGLRQYHAFAVGTTTKGLATYKQRVVVFANTIVDTGSPLIDCFVLRHPTSPAALLREIHYARPIAGALYIVAEFSDGEVFHYWMRAGETWQPNTVYQLGQLLQPTVPNGFVYQVGRIGEPYPLWAPDVVREIGDRVEPTVSNGYYYEVVELIQGGISIGQPPGGATSGGGLGSGTSVGDGVGYGGGGGSTPYTGAITASGGYLGGYVGVPYVCSTMYQDESVRPVVAPYRSAEVEWIGSPPPGLSATAKDTFNHPYPAAVGVPETAGTYNWTARLHELLAFGLKGSMVELGVSSMILPTPTFAVIDPSQRSQYNAAMVDDSPKPLMHAMVGSPTPPTNIAPATAVTTPGATTEDFYAEVKFIRAFNGNSPFGGVRSAWLGVTAAAPLESYRNGAVDIINPDAPPPNTWVYTTRQTGANNIQINDGDIGMIYGQPSTGKLWFGVNGVWVNGGDPTTGDNPFATGMALVAETFAGAFRVFAGGYGDANGDNDEFVINCGNSAFAYTPPNAVTGMAFVAREMDLQFDSQKRSDLVQLQHLGAEAGAVVAQVRDDYEGANFGSAVCEKGHSSGLRQFEINTKDTAGSKVWMGIVRSDFDPAVTTSRVGLANTVGVRPWSDASTDGQIAVDGVTSACGSSNAIDVVFTFAIDLDADTFEVYVDGVLEASGALPVAATEWFPAMSGQTGTVARLRTTDLRYPVAGYTDWSA